VAQRERELTEQLGGLEDLRLERDTALAQAESLREQLASLAGPPQVADEPESEDFSAELASLRAELEGARAQLAAAERSRSGTETGEQHAVPSLTLIDGERQPEATRSGAPAPGSAAAIVSEDAHEALEDIRRERRTVAILVVVVLIVFTLIVAGLLTDVLGAI
jgi:hypothetical protein